MLRKSLSLLILAAAFSTAAYGQSARKVLDTTAARLTKQGGVMAKFKATQFDGTTPQSYNNGSAGGAGGSILLETKTLSIAATARITAKGGDSGSYTLNPDKYTSGGGGGRIAIWSGKAIWERSWGRSRYTVSDELPAEWADVFDVSGGAARLSTAAFAGEDGTLRFISTRGVGGLFIGLY